MERHLPRPEHRGDGVVLVDLDRDLLAARQQVSEAGRAFLPVVAQALHSVETTAASLFGDPKGQPVVVQCSLMMACGWLAPRLPGFHAAHPQVRLTLMTGIHAQDFLRRGANVQITFGTPPGPGEEGDPLFGEALYPVAVPAIARTIGSPADLARHQLYEIATHRANWLHILPQVEAEAELRFCYADTTQLAFAMAAAGGGIALARAPANGVLEKTHGLIPCLPRYSIRGSQSYSLVYPARAGLSRAAKAFRDWLLAECADQE